MNAAASLYRGSCHCAAIGFSYRTRLPPPAWRIRACQCAFCRAHGALTTSDPAGSIEFRERRRGELQRYRFGLRTADFLLCRTCGVYVGAEIAADAKRFGIINVQALGSLPEGLAAALPMDYGSESLAQRIARRQARWSPVVDARG